MLRFFVTKWRDLPSFGGRIDKMAQVRREQGASGASPSTLNCNPRYGLGCEGDDLATRTLTVVFTDLSNYTASVGRADREGLRDLIA